MDEDNKGGRRKDGKRFKDGNMAEDGTYVIGDSRPPEHGKFRKGDGRRRGRRARGTANFDTMFSDESNRVMKFKVDGKDQMAPQLRVVVKTAFHNATVLKRDTAIKTIIEHAQRIDEKSERAARTPVKMHRAIIEEWYADRVASENGASNISDDFDLHPGDQDSDKQKRGDE